VEVLGWVHAHRLALGLRAAEAAAEVGKLDAGPGGTAAQLLFQLTPAGAQRGGGPPGSQGPAEQAVDFSGVLERRGVVRVGAWGCGRGCGRGRRRGRVRGRTQCLDRPRRRSADDAENSRFASRYAGNETLWQSLQFG